MTPQEWIAAALMTAAFVALTPGLRAQAQAEKKDPLIFEVASVKPSTGCPPKCGLVRPTVGNQGYHAEGATLRSLMTIAYSVTDRQISGGPSWINTERFDIDAKAAHPQSIEELHTMLQHLLEERFNLKPRHEVRQESVWDLAVAKGGSKMPVHDPEDKDYPPIGVQMAKGSDGGVCPTLAGHNVTMNYFAFFLSRTLDRAVIDKTGMPARYDVSLQFMPDAARFGGPDGGGPTISPDCTDVFSAVQRQLGLRLESSKGPVDYLVVERAEKPTEN